MNLDFEAIELRSMRDWHTAASAADSADCDWRLVRVGDALCSVSSTEPSILMNRVLGLGSREAPTREQLTRIRALYADAGVARFFLHVVPELLGPDREALLTAAGYRKHRGWMKFTRGPGEVREARTDLTVHPIGTGEATAFAAIAAPAFDISPAFEPVIGALAEAPHWRLYMSYDGEQPVGTGALYIGGHLGALDWGATHPDFRGRGGQTAVLSARLRDAFAAGCGTVCTMTGEAVPGDPQHSYGNIMRAGFTEAYLRENWIPASS